MLSDSVQIELFIILWVTKPIHNKQPMYTVLNKDTIKNEILPHLSIAKRGFISKSSLIEIINAILRKLKIGCQRAYLPVKELFSGKVLRYGSSRSEPDMSSADLDGGHIPAIRGGEGVGYQGRKKRKTTNTSSNSKGLIILMFYIFQH